MSVHMPAAGRMAGRADSPSWPFSFAGVISIGLLYGLVYTCLRLSISHNLPVDDVKSNLYTQTLALGYTAKQPPLYEWLLWLVQRFTACSPRPGSFVWIVRAIRRPFAPLTFHRRWPWCGAKGSRAACRRRRRASLRESRATSPLRPSARASPWRSYPAASAERVWEWVIVVADPGPRE
jgi:hypothetical protein